MVKNDLRINTRKNKPHKNSEINRKVLNSITYPIIFEKCRKSPQDLNGTKAMRVCVY